MRFTDSAQGRTAGTEHHVPAASDRVIAIMASIGGVAVASLGAFVLTALRCGDGAGDGTSSGYCRALPLAATAGGILRVGLLILLFIAPTVLTAFSAVRLRAPAMMGLRIAGVAVLLTSYSLLLIAHSSGLPPD
jgi:hypothetical protein